MRTFVNLTRVDLGFSPDGIVGRMSLQGTSAENASARNRLLEQGIARIRELPGVTSVAVSNNVPVEPGLNLALMPPDGALIDQPRPVDWRYVTPDYFALQNRYARWRHLHRERYGGSSAGCRRERGVCARHFGRLDVVGRTIAPAWTMDRGRSSVSSPMSRRARILDSCATCRSARWDPRLRRPSTSRRRRRQMARFKLANRFFEMKWIVQTSGSSGALEPAMREAIRALDPTLAFTRFETMASVIAAISTCSAH